MAHAPDPFATPYAEPGAMGVRAFEVLDEKLLGPINIVSLALNVVSVAFVPILAVVLLVHLPLNVVEGLWTTDDPKEITFGIVLLQIGVGLVRLISFLVVAKVTEQVVLDLPVSIGGAFQYARGRWLSMVGTQILLGAAIMALFLLFIIPGVWFMVRWIFVQAVVALRDESGLEAANISKELVEGRWWAVLGRVLGMLAILVLPIIVVAILGEVAKEYVGAELFIGIAMSTFFEAVGCVMGVALTLMFLNAERTYRGPYADVLDEP